MSRFRRAFLALAAGLASLAPVACSTGPQVVANQAPGAEHEVYRSYRVQPGLITNDSSYEALLLEHLEAATSREMEARGYQPAQDPDLLLRLHYYTAERTRTHSPVGVQISSGNSLDPYGGANPSAPPVVTSYVEATLAVQVVDTLMDQVIWEASRIVEGGYRANPSLGLAVSEAVEDLFEKYPFVATSAGARASNAER